MHDRFEAKQIRKASAKKDEKEEKGGKSEMKSGKFFKKMQEVAKDDLAKKELKRKAKLEGGVPAHNNGSTKRFKL